MIGFFYEGRIQCNADSDHFVKILENLTKIFGFPKEFVDEWHVRFDITEEVCDKTAIKMKIPNSLIIDSNGFEEESHREFGLNNDSNVIGMYKCENVLPPLVECHMNPSTISDDCDFNNEIVSEGTIMKKKKWPCPICHDVFKNRNSFREHIASVHKGKKPFKCSQCNTRFLHADSLKKHVKACSFHMNKTFNVSALNESEIDNYGSDYSNKCKSNLKVGRKELEHITSVIHETQNLCNVSFETEALWMCPICNIDLKLKEKLKDHIKSSHQGQKVFRCSLCEARFELKDSLNRHLKKKHTIESPIRSDVDDFEMDLNETDISYQCESNLDIGMNELDAHEESVIEFSDSKNSSNTEFEKEVLWICPICNIDLRRKKKLRDHIKSSHQGQKVFRCSLCEANFELKDSLNRHVKTKHTIESSIT